MFEDLRGRKPKLMEEGLYKKFALCVPLLEYKKEPCILFEVRASTLRNQPGEICLPGGSVEKGESFEVAALREISEELLVDRGQVTVIAPMDIHLNTGQFLLPFLVELTDYEGSFSAQEVDEVFYVPVSFFLEQEPVEYRNRLYVEPPEDFPYESIPGGRNYPWHTSWNSVYFYPEYEGHIIWGLTAKVMRSVSEILRASENR